MGDADIYSGHKVMHTYSQKAKQTFSAISMMAKFYLFTVDVFLPDKEEHLYLLTSRSCLNSIRRRIQTLIEEAYRPRNYKYQLRQVNIQDLNHTKFLDLNDQFHLRRVLSGVDLTWGATFQKNESIFYVGSKEETALFRGPTNQLPVEQIRGLLTSLSFYVRENTPGRSILLSEEFGKLIPTPNKSLRFMRDDGGWEEKKLVNVKWTINDPPLNAKILLDGKYHEGNFEDVLFPEPVHAIFDARTGRKERIAELADSRVTLDGTAHQVLSQIYLYCKERKLTRRCMFNGIAKSSVGSRVWRVCLVTLGI